MWNQHTVPPALAFLVVSFSISPHFFFLVRGESVTFSWGKKVQFEREINRRTFWLFSIYSFLPPCRLVCNRILVPCPLDTRPRWRASFLALIYFSLFSYSYYLPRKLVQPRNLHNLNIINDRKSRDWEK